MIKAEAIAKTYGQSVHALRGVSFEIGKNEVVGLLGPNGAGKTTLMKILTGFLHPSEGRAEIAGIDVLVDPLAVQAQIGYLPENAPVYRDMVVQEYLQWVAELREIAPDQQRKLISRAVISTGLEKFLVKPISQLSKGYRQRVGLAQAILHQPKLLILDEPTSGLDPSQIVEIRQLIARLAEEATVLLSTHILSEVELSCERVLIIDQGELRTDERLADLRQGSAAIATVVGPTDEIKAALGQIAGVQDVRSQELGQSDPHRLDGAHRFRVLGGDRQLCATIFDVVQQRGWRLTELRNDQETLESVFRRVTGGKSQDETRRAA
ncbi:MAG: ATP-binding cassette domain-containing protein [Deltaproteobacteria bacterium]|nr:ATP-binding cassette domain-containing protein [Deltaproteobacteria bacterium]